jgi:hypothetical protein
MADNSGTKFLKYYLQKLKSFFLSKDILSFLLFLALSSAFWFVNALGKERETIISLPVRYIGVPQNIAITNNLPLEITLNVKDVGLHLFDYSRSHITPLTIDLKRNFNAKGEILITSDELNAKIGRYIKPTTTLLEVNPDSILVQYMKLSQKTLPIELVSKIELAPQYMLPEKIQPDPAVVTVFGPQRVLRKLKSVQTECLNVKNLNDTNSFLCKLLPEKYLRYSVKEVHVKLLVEQFTEKKVRLPITFVNCPENLYIRTFPAFVNATYTVGLSYFNTVIPKDILVYLDYNDLKSGDLSKQKLKITNNSSHISNIRISPQEVEFILEEK